jgi:ATP-binding cassette, subfamily B, bacterial
MLPLTMTNRDLLMGQVPDELRSRPEVHSLGADACLFSVCSDLAIDGAAHDVWVIVTPTKIFAVATGNQITTPVTGPFLLKDVTKVRTFHTVGSAFLQLLIDGVYVDVARYSNARREAFGKVRAELERLVDGKPLNTEALARASELVCPKCELPLPARRAVCPRCSGGRNIFFRLLSMMKPYRRYILLLLTMMVVGVGLDLLPPYLTAILVDKVLLKKEHIDWLSLILLGLVGASLGRNCLNIFIGRTSSFIGTRITKELRERLQAKLMSLSVDYYDRHSAGSLMSRVLWDVDYFQGFVSQVSEGFLLNVLRVLGIGTVLFTMNWHLALLVLLPVPFVVVGTMFFWKYIYPQYYRLWDSQSKMSQLLTGLLQGIRLVKLFGQENREQQRFSDSARYMQDARRSVEMSSATFGPIMGFVFGLGGLIIWYAGGHRVLEGHLTLGTLMAFFGYMGMFYGPISAMSMFSNWLTGFLSAGQRVFEVLDSNVGITDDPAAVQLPNVKGAIELRNVTFGYDPYSPVLKNVSIKIEPGQFVGIVGKSGSGKTTLVNLICRFYDPQDGQVLIDGQDVRKITQHDIHQHVALVLQESFLFRATIMDNIAYGRPNAAPLAVMDAAKSANAHDFIARAPAAYDTKLGERGAGLSGGERQRISIARALLCDPKILILDEATSSVDTESEQEIQKALYTLCKGRTTIAIAHRLSTLKNSDVIYVIDDGKVVESGSHEQLLELKGVYHNLVRIQTELTRLEA